MHPMLNIAVRAARAGGKIIMRNFDRLDRVRVSEKSAKDFVSDVDRQAEAEIINVLQKAYPDHGILAEESGAQTGAQADGYRWIIDPLDGTTNFLHGFPQFAVSIALMYRARLEQAVVYNPVSQDIYTASRGAGAELNNRRVRVSGCRSLATALIGTGLPFREGDDFDAEFAVLRTFAEITVGVRRPGAASLDLAAVAAGQFDGFYESRLQAWDIAAGALLVREAGGLITDLNGGEDWMKNGSVVAAAPKLLPEMLATLKPYASAMNAGHRTLI